MTDADPWRNESDAEAFWAEARQRHLESWRVPRHLVVDRFSFDPDEIGVTTDSEDGVW